MLQMFRPVLSSNRNLMGIFSWFTKNRRNRQITGKKWSRHVSLLFCWEKDVGSYRSDDVNVKTDQNQTVCGARRRKHLTVFGLSGISVGLVNPDNWVKLRFRSPLGGIKPRWNKVLVSSSIRPSLSCFWINSNILRVSTSSFSAVKFKNFGSDFPCYSAAVLAGWKK